MILTREKAVSLFSKLNDYCKKNNIKVSTPTNGRYTKTGKDYLAEIQVCCVGQQQQ